MEKAFPNRVNWKNLPNRTTPLNETNLNKSDYALRVIDDRVITLDTVKFDKTSANALIKGWMINQQTGVITITWYDNSTQTFDTVLEKIAINFDYDDNPSSEHYQQIIITLSDGTVKYIDLSALITEYEFDNTSTIAFSVDEHGRVSANIRTGSVTDDLIQPHYLADITLQAEAAASSAEASNASANESEYYKNLTISYAVGTNGEIRDIDATDNAKYYKEQAAISEQHAATSKSNSEAFAVGQRNGQEVSPDDVTYHNNSKFYSEQSKAFADDSEQSKLNSEAYAVGKRDGIDVGITDEAYRNNARYYANQANGSATAAYGSQVNASISETNASKSSQRANEYATSAESKSQLANTYASNAQESADDSSGFAELSKSYAVGTNGVKREGDATDNSKFYSEQAAGSVSTASSILNTVRQAGQEALDALENALDADAPEFQIDFTTGHLMYGGGRFVFDINHSTGHLMWGLTV